MAITMRKATDAGLGGGSVTAAVAEESDAEIRAEPGGTVEVTLTDAGAVAVELAAGPEVTVDLDAGAAAEVTLGGSAELRFLPDGALEGYYTKPEADALLDEKADTAHGHDGRYYTKAETAALLAGKSDTGHNHDERYYTEAETDALLDGKSSVGHNHDSRYYTESETDALLGGKADAGHTHDERYYTQAEVDALIAEARESVTEITPAVTRTSGVSSFDSGEAWRAGHTVFLRLAFKSGNSSVSTGSNAFVGTLSGVPLPPTGAIGLGYLGSTVLIGNLGSDGALTIRVAGSNKAASSSNVFGVSWTYLTSED